MRAINWRAGQGNGNGTGTSTVYQVGYKLTNFATELLNHFINT